MFLEQRLVAIATSLCFIISFSVYSQTGQNLIKNYSAENYIVCPFSNGGSLDQVSDWFKPFWASSSDFFHSCATNTVVSTPLNVAGFQVPKTGAGYLGFATYLENITNDNKEYLENKLKQTLKNNSTYCITFYVSLAENSRIATSNIGVIFKKDSLVNHAVPGISQYINTTSAYETTTILVDSINWTKIQFQYAAIGDENFMLIGNFNSNINTNKIILKPLTGIPNKDYSYYYIDDISVVEIKPAKAAAKDTLIVCANATYTLGTDSTWDATYQWQPQTGLSCTNCPNPIITPTNSIKYYLTKLQCSATTKDSVLINIYNTPVTILPLSNATICVGNTITLSVDTNSFYNYNWQPSIGLSCNNCALPIASPSIATTYTLTKSACGFSNSATVNVSIKPNFTLTPQINLTNTITCLYDTLKFTILNAPLSNDINYNWQPQNTFILSFTNTAKATIQNNSYYFVTITNSNNGPYCPFIKKDSIYVSLLDTCIKPLVIPTIFTPNFDNINDVWKFTMPYGTKLEAVYVYNRWGALIYNIDSNLLSSENSKVKIVRWDGHTTSGEECVDGIYFYVVSVTENGAQKTFKGNVTLIR
ncbi:MAG: gliding motility-associated C-terminal domain-containing protein [Bacteroidetes bacterium]|nr:gliding motility-associated C-terminal domain-containing protein [Bacteroidota bacterium]